jgi:hypothetical protein
MDDIQLLREYADYQSEAAFAELVCAMSVWCTQRRCDGSTTRVWPRM